MLRVMVNNANNGGLLSVLDGLPAFVPFSLVPKAPNERLTVEVCPPAELCLQKMQSKAAHVPFE